MPGAGHPAWGIGFRPRYSIPGLESGSDTEAVVVMVGVAPAPAAASVLFMPVRSSQPALLSDITYQLHTLSVAS